jgi:drug/metabolite transporter (DMT)-like permease
MAALAGAFFGGDLVLWTYSIYDVGSGIATVLGNLQVLFVAIIGWAILRERPRTQFLVALPVVLGGVVLLAGVIGHSRSGEHPVAGVLYGLGTSTMRRTR